jgi:hypothetical protein
MRRLLEKGVCNFGRYNPEEKKVSNPEPCGG